MFVTPALAFAIVAADLDRNGVVDQYDGAAVFHHITPNGSTGDGRWDPNGDGVVDVQDFFFIVNLLNSAWGKHLTGDGATWFVPPGRVISLGPSPFPGHRRITFLGPRDEVLAIDLAGQRGVDQNDGQDREGEDEDRDDHPREDDGPGDNDADDSDDNGDGPDDDDEDSGDDDEDDAPDDPRPTGEEDERHGTPGELAG